MHEAGCLSAALICLSVYLGGVLGDAWKIGSHVEMEVVVASTAPEPDDSGPRKVLTSGEVPPSSKSFAGGMVPAILRS